MQAAHNKALAIRWASGEYEVIKETNYSTGSSSIYDANAGGVYEDNTWTGMAFDTTVTGGVGLGAKLISKGGSFLFKKGIGNALVKDTGSILKNTANLRAWAKRNGWVQQNSSGGVEQWGVKNADGTFSWRMKIKAEASTREGLGAGSNQPRIDVRLDDKGTYINPFTGEMGGRSVGTHIPLGK